MLWFLVGAAFALPPALLGPDGPMWVGPLPPGPESSLVVVVDPDSGALHVDERERDGRIRSWAADHWEIDGVALDPEEPETGHRFDDGQLIGVDTSFGERRKVQYDEQGRISALVWGSGGRMTIRYDDNGRVSDIEGPGLDRWGLKWTKALRVTDALGRTTQVDTEQKGASKSIRVTDALGRVAYTQYRLVGDVWRLTGWRDPRGLETRVGRYLDRVDVTSPGGRVFRLTVDDQDRVNTLAMPGGQTWRWERGENGEVQRIVDPVGRITRWERDASGRVTTVSPSGSVMRLRRDTNGRVTSIVSANGATTEFVRNANGRISSIVDALGNPVFIERFENGWPSSITERTGARWNFALDALGLPDRIEDPSGHTIEFRRDSGGRLEGIIHSVFGEVRIERATDGQITKVVNAEGSTTTFVRDAADRVVAIKRADGQELRVSRDPLGEVVAVTWAGEQMRIERTPAGWVRRIGDQVWERDINGLVRSLRSPGYEMTILRDPTGWIRSLQTGDWNLEIGRDVHGWPVQWTGTDGTIEVQRDSAGRIIIETGEREFRVLRDSRGLPVRLVVSGAGEWRWQRDGSGRVLTAKGPGGADIGVDRDSAGRIKLVRYPNGTLLRRTHDRSTMTDKLTGPGGQLLVSGSTVFGLDGLVESTEVSGEAGWAVKRDKAGALVGMEATDGTSWTWTAEATEDPEGQVHINDVDGRLMEAQLPLGPKAWGIATEMMSVHRDLAGRMVQLGGDGGLSELESDALGRLVGIRPPDASGWKMRFDARGRPVGWTGPIGSSEQWVWAPEADPRDGREGLLVSGAGGETVWNSVAGGDGVRQTDGTIEGLMAGSDEEVAWVISTDGAPVRVRHTPTGFPEVDVAGIAAGGGGVQWFPGGPTQWGSVAIDPVSGERVDGMQRWPWAVHGAVDVDIADRWDTSVWSPEGPWSNPMQMLTEMGELPKIEAGRWMRLGADPVGFYGVAESLDGVVQPLGPAMDAVPLDVEDPITMALLRSVLPGGDAPDALTPAAALIGAEIDLPWMPPGWVIPGLERWTLLGAWRDDDELQ